MAVFCLWQTVVPLKCPIELFLDKIMKTLIFRGSMFFPKRVRAVSFYLKAVSTTGDFLIKGSQGPLSKSELTFSLGQRLDQFTQQWHLKYLSFIVEFTTYYTTVLK